MAGVSVKSGATVRYQLSGTSYSPLGELRSATEWKRTLWGDLTFLYDSVYGTRRLLASTSDVSGQEYAYTYDVFGNRLSEIHNSTLGGTCNSSVTFGYGTDSRLLQKSQSGTCTPFRRFITDQAGMRVAELDSLSGYAGVKSAMTYTAAGQLYYAMTPQATVGPYDHAWHWYDAGGQRIMSHLATSSTLDLDIRPDSAWGTRTYYINDGANVALTLVKGASSWRIHQRYLSTGLDEMAAVRISINGTPTNVATVGDRQNGFIMAVDAQGNEVPEAGFYVKGPFGQQEPGTSAATSGHTGLGFTGAGAPNTSGGYVYLRNRWYDPATGRFLSQDPIGLAGGVNLYAYAGNDPISYADPFGLCPCTGWMTSFWARSTGSQIAKVEARKSAGPDKSGAIIPTGHEGLLLGGGQIGLGIGRRMLAMAATRATRGVGAYATKSGARAALAEMGLPEAQRASVNRAIGRGTTRTTYDLVRHQSGEVTVRLMRPGGDGFQMIESIVASDGSKRVVQKGVNDAGKVVHFDPKTP